MATTSNDDPAAGGSNPPNTRVSWLSPPRIAQAWSPQVVGAVLIYFAVFGAYFVWISVGRLAEHGNDATTIVVFVAAFTFVSALLISGVRIILSTTKERLDIIYDKDRSLLEPLIKEANEKAIDQYVRLSSLTGATGLATKLGLTGLPLVTVALTLIFAGLSILQPGPAFMDLTKLTLGAFIGSFVQRSVTTQAIAVSGKLPPS